jgi:hypothetical protein
MARPPIVYYSYGPPPDPPGRGGALAPRHSSNSSGPSYEPALRADVDP